jgi:mannose-6-phosphate isomerase-like protein (cupin superfamily)
VHTHDDASKFYLVVEGHAHFHIADETQKVGPGQAVLARAGESHGVENATEERLVLLVGIAPPPTHA